LAGGLPQPSDFPLPLKSILCSVLPCPVLAAAAPISLHCCLRAERAAPADRFFFLHEVVAQLILSGCLFSLGSPKVSIFMWIVAGTRSGHILEPPD
jgi:hypothetical protein